MSLARTVKLFVEGTLVGMLLSQARFRKDNAVIPDLLRSSSVIFSAH